MRDLHIMRDLRVKIGSLVNNSLTLSAELATNLVNLRWVAELAQRLGTLAEGLGEVIEQLRRVATGVGEIVEDAGRVKEFAKRVMEGGKALFRAIRRGFGGSSVGRTFREIRAGWCPEMVEIPPGRFLMGSAPGEADSHKDERPQHEVEIAYRLAFGRYPVTFEQYDHFCRETRREEPGDAGWGRGRRPVIDVSWNDATAYCEWLSRETRASYRLPSEAEWEYACRAGTTTAYSWGDEFDPKRAKGGHQRDRTSDVGSFPANAWGLHDMHGNVWEWCADLWHDTYESAPADGSAWKDGGNPPRRVLRGGSWNDNPRNLRSANRGRYAPEYRLRDAGFRVARMLTS